jgi:hypothetical protein
MKFVVDMNFFVLYEMFVRVLIGIVCFSVFYGWAVSDGVKMALVVFFGLWAFVPAIKAGMVYVNCG